MVKNDFKNFHENISHFYILGVFLRFCFLPGKLRVFSLKMYSIGSYFVVAYLLMNIKKIEKSLRFRKIVGFFLNCKIFLQ